MTPTRSIWGRRTSPGASLSLDRLVGFSIDHIGWTWFAASCMSLYYWHHRLAGPAGTKRSFLKRMEELRRDRRLMRMEALLKLDPPSGAANLRQSWYRTCWLAALRKAGQSRRNICLLTTVLALSRQRLNGSGVAVHTCVRIRVVKSLRLKATTTRVASEWFMPLVRELEASNATCPDKDQKLRTKSEVLTCNGGHRRSESPRGQDKDLRSFAPELL